MNNDAWTSDEIALVDAGIRAGLTRAQIAATIPTRSLDAVARKARLQRRVLGIPAPPSKGRAKGCKRAYSGPMGVPTDAPAIGSTYEERAELAAKIRGSQMLLEAYARYYERHVRRAA